MPPFSALALRPPWLLALRNVAPCDLQAVFCQVWTRTDRFIDAVCDATLRDRLLSYSRWMYEAVQE